MLISIPYCPMKRFTASPKYLHYIYTLKTLCTEQCSSLTKYATQASQEMKRFENTKLKLKASCYLVAAREQ